MDRLRRSPARRLQSATASLMGRSRGVDGQSGTTAAAQATTTWEATMGHHDQGQQGSGMGKGQQDKDRMQSGEDGSEGQGTSGGSMDQAGYAGDRAGTRAARAVTPGTAVGRRASAGAAGGGGPAGGG